MVRERRWPERRHHHRDARHDVLRALPSCGHEAEIGARLFEGLPLAAALHRGCLGDSDSDTDVAEIGNATV